jgi:hypothetical protein
MRYAALALAGFLAGCRSAPPEQGVYEKPIYHPAPVQPPAPACVGHRIGPTVAVVRCRVFSQYTVDRAGFIANRMAAIEALTVGRTHFSMMRSQWIEDRGVPRTIPVECRSEYTRNQRVGSALQAFADNQADTSDTTCRNDYLGGVRCNTTHSHRPASPAPIPQTKCWGGDVVWDRNPWVDAEYTYELLAPEEAAARANPLLPADRLPLDAGRIVQITAPDGTLFQATASGSPASPPVGAQSSATPRPAATPPSP